MLLRYKILVDVYECSGESCDHEGGHAIRKNMKINVTAETDLEARRKVLAQCYAVGNLVRKLTIKEVSSIS